MKKLVILSLVVVLTLTVAANALAAVHNYDGDFSNRFLRSHVDFQEFEG